MAGCMAGRGHRLPVRQAGHASHRVERPGRARQAVTGQARPDRPARHQPQQRRNQPAVQRVAVFRQVPARSQRQLAGMHVDRQVPQPGQLQRRAGVIGVDVRQQDRGRTCTRPEQRLRRRPDHLAAMRPRRVNQHPGRPGSHEVDVGPGEPAPRFQAVHALGDLFRADARIPGILDPVPRAQARRCHRRPEPVIQPAVQIRRRTVPVPAASVIDGLEKPLRPACTGAGSPDRAPRLLLSGAAAGPLTACATSSGWSGIPASAFIVRREHAGHQRRTAHELLPDVRRAPCAPAPPGSPPARCRASRMAYAPGPEGSDAAVRRGVHPGQPACLDAPLWPGGCGRPYPWPVRELPPEHGAQCAEVRSWAR